MKSFVRKNKSLFHIVSYARWFGYDVKIIRVLKKVIVSSWENRWGWCGSRLGINKSGVLNQKRRVSGLKPTYSPPT